MYLFDNRDKNNVPSSQLAALLNKMIPPNTPARPVPSAALTAVRSLPT